MVKNLRPGPALIAAEISKYLGPVTFLVHVRDGQTSKRHVDHPKYYMTMACKTILQLNQMEMNFVDCNQLQLLPPNLLIHQAQSNNQRQQPQLHLIIPPGFVTLQTGLCNGLVYIYF